MFYETEGALIATYQGTVVPTSYMLPTAPAAVYTQCVWQRAQQDLPDVISAAQQALDAAGVGNSRVKAQAYGENCLDTRGNVQYFAAMTTDFYVTLGASDLEAETVATVCDAIPRAI